MDKERFKKITSGFAGLRVVVAGDFCLDRYLEIDPAKKETSIETGLPVYNVVETRPQPGGAGTVVNNLAALGIGTVVPVGFCGNDGEGWELRRCLSELHCVEMEHFMVTNERKTFTYMKPLLIRGDSPAELNRIDIKNWSATPRSVQNRLIKALTDVCPGADAVILLDQVDQHGTGVLTDGVLGFLGEFHKASPDKLIIADSRSGLGRFPPFTFKMNLHELQQLSNRTEIGSLASIQEQAAYIAKRNKEKVFITLGDKGILACDKNGHALHQPALPVRGNIDIVGAGDSVTAALTSTLAAGGSVQEAVEIANAAASTVIHQIGTTGAASVDRIHKLIFPAG